MNPQKSEKYWGVLEERGPWVRLGSPDNRKAEAEPGSWEAALQPHTHLGVWGLLGDKGPSYRFSLLTLSSAAQGFPLMSIVLIAIFSLLTSKTE